MLQPADYFVQYNQVESKRSLDIERTAMKKLIFTVSILLIAFLFTGCVTLLSSTTTIKLDASEKWEVNQELLFDGVSYKSGGQAVVDGLNSLVAQGKSSGVDITFEQLPDRQGNVPYTITIKGEGIDQLNELLSATGSGSTAFTRVTVEGKTVYGFQMPAKAMTSGDLNFTSAPDVSFVIEGMKVLKSNGQQTGNSVTWKNPTGTMTATLAPTTSGGGSFAWWIIPLAVVGLAAVVLVVLLATGKLKKKQPAAQPQYVYPAGYGAQPPQQPSAPVMPVTPPQPQPAAPVYTPPAPQPVPPSPVANPPSTGESMPTIIGIRPEHKEESSGQETIMVPHPSSPKPPTEEPPK
jgi:hypothetical protein